MKNIVINEWKGLFRNRLFLVLVCIFTIALLLTTYLGILQNNTQILAQKEAQEHIREQWDSMDPTNPHRAAHFGSYAFKPTNLLNSLDEGINAVTGNVLRLEGHTQNDVMFSEASQSLLISKFGKLKPSLLFQFIIPLFLIFLSFNSYIAERESGRLKLLLVQGASLKKIVFSKVFSIWIIGFLLLISTTFVQLIFNTYDLGFDAIFRLILFVCSYGCYYLTLITLTVLLSLIFKNATGALSLSIVIWVMWTVFLPKIIGNTVEKISPLPTRVEFQNAMDVDRSKGIDGHNPSGDRKKELEEKTLAKYQVNSVSELPVNFSGILMQADEEYGNDVWDKHFGSLYKQLQIQKRNYQLSGFFNPFASIQSLSMGTAGTDMFHHLDFLKQAENYRRFFIKKLNNEYAFGGSKTGDRNWKADTKFFQSVKDFSYTFPVFLSFLSKYILDILFLFIWSVCLLFWLKYSSEKTIFL
jgi:ABC-2 type transport system permease protein